MIDAQNNVVFIRNVMRSEFIPLMAGEEDYVEVSEGTQGRAISDGVIELVSINDDDGYIYPKDSYEQITD
jgi:hypothetical protein